MDGRITYGQLLKQKLSPNKDWNNVLGMVPGLNGVLCFLKLDIPIAEYAFALFRN